MTARAWLAKPLAEDGSNTNTWVRLPEAIRKMTSFPAQRPGLRDRGMLRDGMKADVVVFNSETVKSPAT